MTQVSPIVRLISLLSLSLSFLYPKPPSPTITQQSCPSPDPSSELLLPSLEWPPSLPVW